MEIQFRKQLKRRLKIAVEEDQVVFVDFKYERLLALCYCCGIIGHNEADCALAIKKKREGVANPAQYGKWIRAPIRQNMMREISSNGGRGDKPNQFRATNRSENWRNGREDDDQGVEIPAAEEVRGNSVITAPVGNGREDTKKGPEYSNESDDAHGKEEEAMAEALTIQLGKVEKGMKSEEMVWQKVEVEVQVPKMGKEEHEIKVLGHGEAQGSSLGNKQPLEIESNKAYWEVNSATNQYHHSNGIGGEQSKWKRKAREELKAKNEGPTVFVKLGKRGITKGNKGTREEEEQGKRRRVLGDIVTNIQAVADDQPRRNQ